MWNELRRWRKAIYVAGVKKGVEQRKELHGPGEAGGAESRAESRRVCSLS